jgi:excisionase family DNA binding protein
VKRLTVKQAASKLGLSRGRVHALIRVGRLPAQRIGIQFLVNPTDLSAVPVGRAGRPKKKG